MSGIIPLLRNALVRGPIPTLKLALQRFGHFAKTGYLHTAERACPDFPNEVFENHVLVYKFLRQFVGGKHVLEIGCGTGYGTAILAEHAASIEAMDYSPQAISYARSHLFASEY